MGQRFDKIRSALGSWFLKPLLVLFFSLYHTVLMLAAPVFSIKLGLAEHAGGLKELFRAVFGALYPEDPSALGVLWIIVLFAALAAWVIGFGVLVIHIPQAIAKWNIKRLVTVLYGRWQDSLAYLAMTFAPAIYLTVVLLGTGRISARELLPAMMIAVISQFGVLAPLALRLSLDETRAAWKAAGEERRAKRRALLQGALVPAFALPLLALALLIWWTAIRLAPDVQAIIVFHVSLAAALYGSIVFYRRHFDEFFELLVSEDTGASD